jgi:hypothetical protein
MFLCINCMILTAVASIDFLFNIPFGYWRSSEKTFSLNWFLSIHIPIPFIVLLRHYSGIGFELYTYPFMIISFILGQFIGKFIFNFMKSENYLTSKCICKDVYSNFIQK